MALLWGACDALFTPRPLAPVPTSPATPRAQPTPSGAGGSRCRHARRAERQPAAGLRDRTADESRSTSSRPAVGRTCAVVITYRDDEVVPGHPLHFVLGDLPRLTTRRLILAPLSREAVATLARRAQRPVRDLHRITAGNPLFVTEVLAASGTAVPGTIREAVLARAARLTAGARRIADVVSVVPAAEGWLIDQLLRSRQRRRRWLPGDRDALAEDGAVSYRHELVRRAVEESLPPAQRRELHASVLRALAGRRTSPAARPRTTRRRRGP
jgi:hypothetical protein